MRSTEFQVDASSEKVIDITAQVKEFCAGQGDGLCLVFAPHATAGLALMETGSGSEADLESTLERLLPHDDRYSHQHGSRGHGADHLLPVFISPSLTVAVREGRLVLGTWQSIVLVDTNVDNPRRRIQCSFVPSPG
ncbi:MAG: secondary thiamine-phosphate synthase enzyme YjbQ [Actinobacteria bacterium]|jgi:secondary thiamine-phosphate synthase enzyme|nr:secondary thiamine-phosphate synthase enzyme YjbQ [Actinomycetota bacterium]MCL6094299.1 secondary thiamine-phosphate synthase enzyme YjbQ [Actinomycetota bacterium]